MKDCEACEEEDYWFPAGSYQSSSQGSLCKGWLLEVTTLPRDPDHARGGRPHHPAATRAKLAMQPGAGIRQSASL